MSGCSFKNAIAAGASEDGMQQAAVRVRGDYSPDMIVVERGRPVRLTFLRDESSPCSETVVFEHFDIRATLPQGEPVAVEITPNQPGSYPFGCEMGMYRGTLVVR
jgi:plastocyanin domain-containing protein